VISSMALTVSCLLCAPAFAGMHPRTRWQRSRSAAVSSPTNCACTRASAPATLPRASERAEQETGSQQATWAAAAAAHRTHRPVGARLDSRRRLGLQQQVVHVSGQQGVVLTLKLLQTSICVWVACLLALCAACMVVQQVLFPCMLALVAHAQLKLVWFDGSCTTRCGASTCKGSCRFRTCILNKKPQKKFLAPCHARRHCFGDGTMCGCFCVCAAGMQL
jgi:hypothetical protein